MYCKNCGNEIKEDEKYCGKCGTKVDDNVLNSSTDTDIDTNKINNKEPIKIKFSYFIIGIIILFLLPTFIIFIKNSSSSIQPVGEATRDYQSTNVSKTQELIKDDKSDFPIYIGKAYVGERNDLTYYITFLSGGELKYVAKYKYGLVEDTILKGKYEIDGNTIKVTIKVGAISTETYTIIDKNTIKSGTTTYTLSDN